MNLLSQKRERNGQRVESSLPSDRLIKTNAGQPIGRQT
jgi:hypothetical protein